MESSETFSKTPMSGMDCGDGSEAPVQRESFCPCRVPTAKTKFPVCTGPHSHSGAGIAKQQLPSVAITEI